MFYMRENGKSLNDERIHAYKKSIKKKNYMRDFKNMTEFAYKKVGMRYIYTRAR